MRRRRRAVIVVVAVGHRRCRRSGIREKLVVVLCKTLPYHQTVQAVVLVVVQGVFDVGVVGGEMEGQVTAAEGRGAARGPGCEGGVWAEAVEGRGRGSGGGGGGGDGGGGGV